jgi:hypothetical protein
MQPLPIPNPISLDEVMKITDLSVLEDHSILEGLAAFINQMILQNFERLVQLLYRIDVSEYKIKHLLQEHPKENAGIIIATLIVDRLKKRQETLKSFNQFDDADCNEERW